MAEYVAQQNHVTTNMARLKAQRLARRSTPFGAINKPLGDNARKGAVKKRSQRKGKLMGKTAWTKRDKNTGQFMDVKKSEKKFKGVRREKAARTSGRRERGT